MKSAHKGVGYQLQRGGRCAADAHWHRDAMGGLKVLVVLLLAEVFGFEKLLKENNVSTLRRCSAHERLCFVRVGSAAAAASELSGSDFHVHHVVMYRRPCNAACENSGFEGASRACDSWDGEDTGCDSDHARAAAAADK